MDVQSLSIVTPTKRCVNDCPFCVSKMHESPYENVIDKNFNDYKKRLEFARDNGCNTMLITGTAEPLQNKSFLKKLFLLNEKIDKPFRWIEFQTTGVFLNDSTLKFLKDGGVSTIALSVADLFFDENNMEIMKVPPHLKFDLNWVCDRIKYHDLNLRLSLNLTKTYDLYTAEEIFKCAKHFSADQLIFRKMYMSERENTIPDFWLKTNSINPVVIKEIENYVIENGTMLEKLPFGLTRYSVNGISTVVDDDCMARNTEHVIKSLILRPNAKLYTRWNDEGSLLF